MTRRLDRIERESAEDALQSILNRTRLDSFHVRERELTLCFFSGESGDDRPVYVWLMTGAPTVVCARDLAEWPAPPVDTAGFHASRAELLPMIYRLLGDSVASTALAPDGALSVNFAERSLIVTPGDQEPDEIWLVTDRTPDTFDAQGWRISLANDGRVALKRPGR